MSKNVKPYKYFLRSSLFNLCFYTIIGMFCIALLPMLFMPRKIVMVAVYIFVYTTAFLEKYILGLTYEVRGTEHLPKNPPYIIAAKHQSAYETFKLHLLFNNPAIILKKELLKIPLWGQYLKKSGVIAINRSSPRTAIKSMQEGAKQMAAQNRPIVVFPQGTRVAPDTGTDEKPYKAGIARIQKATGLPIIPMATNSGVFYPKGKWCKKSGRVIFEFMPAIKPSNKLGSSSLLKQLEQTIEKKSSELVKEARESLQQKQNKPHPVRAALIGISLLIIAYSTAWFYTANMLEKAYISWVINLQHDTSIKRVQSENLRISGYPLKIKVSLPHLRITSFEGKLDIKDINAQGWPFPNSLIELQTGIISIKANQWKNPVNFDMLRANFKLWNNALTIHKAMLVRQEARAIISGTATLESPPKYPKINLDILLNNYNIFLTELINRGIIKRKHAMMASFVLKTLEKEDGLHTNLTSQENKIYLGSIMIYKFPKHKNL